MGATGGGELWHGHGGQTRMLALPGGPVRVHVAGQGPALVLLHGWGMGAAAFAAQAALAGDGFQLVAPDLPGFARSRPWAPPPDLETLAALTIDLVDALDLDRPVVVGWSMGATIGWLAGARAPNALAGIISLDMSPRIASAPDWPLPLTGGYSGEDRARSAGTMLRDWPATCAAFVPRILAPRTDGSPPDVALTAMLAELAHKADPASAAVVWQSLAGADLRDTFASLDLPLLAIHGGRSALYDAQAARCLAALNPRCRVEIVPEAGHAPHLEATGDVNALIATFATACQADRLELTDTPQPDTNPIGGHP